MRFLGGLFALLLSASTAFGQGVPGQSWTNAVLNAPVTTSPGSTDVLAIIQGGVTKQISYGNLILGGGSVNVTQIVSQIGNFASVPIYGTPCTQPNPFCQPFVNFLNGTIGAGNNPSIGLNASYSHPGTFGLLLAPLWSQIWDNGLGLSTALALNTNLYGSNATTALQGISLNANVGGTNAGAFSASIEAETIMLGPANAFGLIIEAGGDGTSGHGMNSFVNFKNIGVTSGHACDVTHNCSNNDPLYGISFGTGGPGSTAPYSNPIQITGTLITVVGPDQFVAANGIDLSNSGGGGAGITGCAYKSTSYCVDGTGNIATSGVAYILQSTAMPAGGTQGAGLKFSTTANFGIFFGSNVPTLAAAKGSFYLRSDGSSGSTRAYINTDGSTTWTSITTGF